MQWLGRVRLPCDYEQKRHSGRRCYWTMMRPTRTAPKCGAPEAGVYGTNVVVSTVVDTVQCDVLCDMSIVVCKSYVRCTSYVFKVRRNQAMSITVYYGHSSHFAYGRETEKHVDGSRPDYCHLFSTLTQSQLEKGNVPIRMYVHRQWQQPCISLAVKQHGASFR